MCAACQHVAIFEVEADSGMRHGEAMHVGDGTVVGGGWWECLGGGTTRMRKPHHGGVHECWCFDFRVSKVLETVCWHRHWPNLKISDVNVIICPKYLIFFPNVSCFCHLTSKPDIQNSYIWNFHENVGCWVYKVVIIPVIAADFIDIHGKSLSVVLIP